MKKEEVYIHFQSYPLRSFSVLTNFGGGDYEEINIWAVTSRIGIIIGEKL